MNIHMYCTYNVPHPYHTYLPCIAHAADWSTNIHGRGHLKSALPTSQSHLQVVASHTTTSQVLAPRHTFYQWTTGRTDAHMWGTLLTVEHGLSFVDSAVCHGAPNFHDPSPLWLQKRSLGLCLHFWKLLSGDAWNT